MASYITIKKNRDGFLLVEIIISLGLLSALISAFVGILYTTASSYYSSGIRNRAIMLAEESLEIVKNIRDDRLASVESGLLHCLSDTGNFWSILDGSNIIGIYTRSMDITDINSQTKNIVFNVSWVATNNTPAGHISLSSRITDWRKSH